ncbi:MAG TPA: 50S ribosomal protein L29 [Gemmatimonadales bacterium]|nr:50S ribosomal protein L29 [Gemmatimonadales bacterium]
MSPKTTDRRRELAELSVEELQQKLAEAREEGFRLRFRRATETLDNPMRLRALRRDIARMETVLRQKRGEG